MYNLIVFLAVLHANQFIKSLQQTQNSVTVLQILEVKKKKKDVGGEFLFNGLKDPAA